MDTPTDSSPPAAAAPSLIGLRVAAAIGLVVATALVVGAFTLAWWLGLLALATVPVVLMGFVIVFEALRRRFGR